MSSCESVWLHTHDDDDDDVKNHFAALLEQVEAVIKEEQIVRPKSTIYLMGEAYGGVLALLLAARNPHVNLVLVLIDPGENFFLCLSLSFLLSHSLLK